ncbi:MAG: putative nucleic acid-binding protein [Candidatus Nitrosomirales archaeon]|jgi:predicted nucleic acid-binding protein
MRIYLDTSALVKQFSSETRGDIINTVFHKCREGELIVVTSYWSLLEAMAAIDRKYHQRGEIRIDERDSTLQTLLGYSYGLGFKETIELIPIPEATHLARMISIIITNKHLSADDSLQLVSARIGECEIFVLADNRFAKIVKEDEEQEKFKVYNILDDVDYGELKRILGS